MSYNTRNKIAKLKYADAKDDDGDFSSSDSEYKQSEDESSTDEDESSSENENQSSSGSAESFCEFFPSKSNKKIKHSDCGENIYVIKSDDYFSHNSEKKTVVSNNVLDKLETPRIQQDELHKLLSKEQLIKHNKYINKEHDLSRYYYSKWMFWLQEGFNILLYGLGSKLEALENFQKSFLKDMPVLVINGFFPSLSIKNIVETILADFLKVSESISNIYEACDIIAQEFRQVPTYHLYIIINNIEGSLLRNSKAQTVLSRLADIKNIHLVASIDHISAPLIWDNFKLSKFNFIWSDVTSFLPYLSETSFEGSLIVQRSKTLALSSLNNVFLSLTSNSKGIYLIIVKYQLENGSNQHYQGFLFKDLYAACREAFFVTSDLTLRSHLTEFVDHKMIRNKRSADGSEYLVISISSDILQQFYDEQSTN